MVRNIRLPALAWSSSIQAGHVSCLGFRTCHRQLNPPILCDDTSATPFVVVPALLTAAASLHVMYTCCHSRSQQNMWSATLKRKVVVICTSPPEKGNIWDNREQIASRIGDVERL